MAKQKKSWKGEEKLWKWMMLVKIALCSEELSELFYFILAEFFAFYSWGGLTPWQRAFSCSLGGIVAITLLLH